MYMKRDADKRQETKQNKSKLEGVPKKNPTKLGGEGGEGASDGTQASLSNRNGDST